MAGDLHLTLSHDLVVWWFVVFVCCHVAQAVPKLMVSCLCFLTSNAAITWHDLVESGGQHLTEGLECARQTKLHP